MDRSGSTPELLEPIASWLHAWFCNDNYTAMAQVIVALTLGILLSPWSSGLFFLIIFIILYELFYYIFTKGNPRYYNVFVRTGVIFASIFGYILGRTLSGDEILTEGI
jgi:4-hydroxybenzoate polyprenyltransferase